MSIVTEDTLRPQSELDAMRDVTIADITQADQHETLEAAGPIRLNHDVLLSKLG
jgi:hypothetical protein